MSSDQPRLKHRRRCVEILAGDRCHLQELFHPARDDVAIGYSLAVARVAPGGRTDDHYLDQSEMYYVVSGRGRMVMGGESYTVTAGSCFLVPPGCHQYLVNEGEEPIEFLCIVEPPWTASGEYVAPFDEADRDR